MYLKRLQINNYGSIDQLSVNGQFDENGNPCPIVFVGKNGSGKTLAIVNMVDALVELKRNTFGNGIQEVAQNKYFKVGSHGYIKNGCNYSRCYLEFKHDDNSLKYYDLMAKEPNKIIDSGIINVLELADLEEFRINGYSRKCDGILKNKDFNDFILLYFPADRYYLPLWYNKGNYNKITYVTDSDIKSSKSNFIKIDLLSNIKDWLTDIFLERLTQQVQMPNDVNIPNDFRGKVLNVMLQTDIQSLITQVLSVITGGTAEMLKTNRKNKQIAFNNIQDIAQLSEGEMHLFSMALSIIREWDIHHEKIDLNQINGIVIIDEAELGLHIDYAYRALPKMMKLFPKVQFILTAHSPFLLAGLYKEYDKHVTIISMPSGTPIENIVEYYELEKAEEIINSISGNDKKIDEKKKQLENLIAKMKNEQGKIYVYTEGDTDAILINKAIEKLEINGLDLIVNSVNCSANKKGNVELCRLLETLSSNKVNNNIVIGVFDRDVDQKVKDSHGNEIALKQQEYAQLGNNTYAFILPIPHDRAQEDQISIEHFFTDAEIKTHNEQGQRLFLGNEFNKIGNHLTENFHYHYIDELYKTIKIIEHETRKYVTDKEGNGDFSLSKMHFAEAVKKDMDGFNFFDFSEFNKIFDIIRRIVKAARGE